MSGRNERPWARSDERTEQLARALRENLRKRKVQIRARAEAAATPADETAGDRAAPSADNGPDAD